MSTDETYEKRGEDDPMAQKGGRTAWERIKEALIDAGYSGTQSDVERLLGIKQPSVSEWNRPGVTPGLENAIALAGRLGVCVEWILTERGPKRPGPPMEPAALKLWDMWQRIPEEERHEVIGYAEGKTRPSQGRVSPPRSTPKK